jgi:hypothetical protein
MVGCGDSPHPEMLRNRDVTAAEMEEVLKNLDRRLTDVEQILPTLATKEDLKAFATKEDLKAFATKEEMKELFSEAKRHALMLFEQTQEQLEIIAAHVADISQRLPPRS